MALQPWRIGKVTRIENETEDTRRFWIEVNELQSFDFIPGQFVTLDLPIHEKPNKRWRSYSIASWPDGTNVWIGSVDSNWFIANNWSCAIVPDQFTDVIIPGNLSVYPVINTDAAVRRISAHPNANVTIVTGAKLNISGR